MAMNSSRKYLSCNIGKKEEKPGAALFAYEADRAPFFSLENHSLQEVRNEREWGLKLLGKCYLQREQR